MPYKEKLKNPSGNPKKKPGYRVTNWTEYNKSLKRRGMLSLLFPQGDVRGSLVNDEAYVVGVSGRQNTYNDSYIELIYTFYRLFDWGIRQTIGYFEDIWKEKGLDIEVPRALLHFCRKSSCV